MAVVSTFVIGCAVVLMVGCAGAATNKEQGHSPQATVSEKARCDGTRTIEKYRREVFTTNDLPGCPKGGLLSGTNGKDKLWGGEGDDEIRGLGAKDWLEGGAGNDVIYAGPGDDPSLFGDDGPAAGDDVIYGGPGDDEEISGGNGDDVIYGGDGDDVIYERWDRGRDKLYCGKGKDEYEADKMDYVDSSCEKKVKLGRPVQ